MIAAVTPVAKRRRFDVDKLAVDKLLGEHLSRRGINLELQTSLNKSTNAEFIERGIVYNDLSQEDKEAYEDTTADLVRGKSKLILG